MFNLLRKLFCPSFPKHLQWGDKFQDYVNHGSSSMPVSRKYYLVSVEVWGRKYIIGTLDYLSSEGVKLQLIVIHGLVILSLKAFYLTLLSTFCFSLLVSSYHFILLYLPQILFVLFLLNT